MHPPFRLEVCIHLFKRLSLRWAYRLSASVHHGSDTHHPEDRSPSSTRKVPAGRVRVNGLVACAIIRFLNNVTCNKSYHKVSIILLLSPPLKRGDLRPVERRFGGDGGLWGLRENGAVRGALVPMRRKQQGYLRHGDWRLGSGWGTDTLLGHLTVETPRSHAAGFCKSQGGVASGATVERLFGTCLAWHKSCQLAVGGREC